VNTIFYDFQKSFAHFFDEIDQYFINELIVNMYTNIIDGGSTIVKYGEKFQALYFIMSGGVTCFLSGGYRDFLFLPPDHTFGDYQIIFNLKSNCVYK
jgi:hypothetical protein